MNQYDRSNVLIKRIKEPSMPLFLSEMKVSSQNGENGIILEIVKRIFSSENKQIFNGKFLEFGCETGKETNMGFFADWLQWSGSFIESDINYFLSLSKKYRYSNKIICYNDFITENNINSYVDSDLDVLSIDIDSQDYYIWKAISVLPKIVIIEYNASLKVGQKMVLNKDRLWDGTTAFGASIESLIDLGKSKGYSLVYTDLAGVNAFFILNKYIHLFDEAKDPIIHGPNYSLSSISHPETEEDAFTFIDEVN